MPNRSTASILALSLLIAPLGGLALLPTPPAAAQGVTAEDLAVASVNDEQITARQLINRLLEYRGAEALEKMIARTILNQEAQRLKVSVTDTELKDRMAEIQKRFKSDADYREVLRRSHLTEEQHREETRITLLIQKVALASTPIQDADLEQLDVRLIDAPDRLTAEKLIKQLDGGANFAQLASKEAVTKALRQAGGRLTPFLKVERVDVWQGLEDQKVKPGGYTKIPVKLTDETWAVLLVEARIPVSQVAAAERDRLWAVLTAHHVEEWLGKSREKAKVEKRSFDQPVVAVINGESISRAQLVARLLAYHGEEALEQFVNRTLLIQSAKAAGVTVSEEEADKKFHEVRDKFKDATAWEAFLIRANTSEKQVRDEVRYTYLMEKVALKQSPVTDEDLQQYEIRMIEAPSKAKAEEWIKELDGGMAFERMAAQRNLNPRLRASGGMLDRFIKIDLLDVWRAMDAEGLKPGNYLRKPVLLTNNAWTLIKLEKVVPINGLPAEDRAALTNKVTGYRVGQWLTQARDRAKFGYPVELNNVVKALASSKS